MAFTITRRWCWNEKIYIGKLCWFRIHCLICDEIHWWVLIRNWSDTSSAIIRLNSRKPQKSIGKHLRSILCASSLVNLHFDIDSTQIFPSKYEKHRMPTLNNPLANGLFHQIAGNQPRFLTFRSKQLARGFLEFSLNIDEYIIMKTKLN